MNKQNYIPLYRKYRPQTLEELVGQEHIKKTLTSAIELGKISHAYLFTGPRGTGKTSTARILAKSLNCVNGPTVHPCGECESCKDITNSVPLDVLEIDAASNRSIDDAKNILEKIQYAPVNGKYKIYIIDEVHMLTKEAFNTLLKTLEEPPENVVFILATTEIHKVLDTIKSRCQRYDFKRITLYDIVERLKYISKNESIDISEDALFAIAKNSAGGMRDAISLLDQLSILGMSQQVTADDVNSILGRLSFDVLYKLAQTIIDSSPASTIELLNNVYNSGNEPLQILTNMSEYFKNLLIVKNCSENLFFDLTGLNESQITEINKQKEQLESHQIIYLIDRIAHYLREIKYAINQHLWLEICFIDLANMTENSTLIDLQNRILALENKASIDVSTDPLSINRPVQTVVQGEKAEALKLKNNDVHVIKAIKQPAVNGSNICSVWQNLLLNISSPPAAALFKLAEPIKISKEEVIINAKNENLLAMMSDISKKNLLIRAADTLFNQNETPVKIIVAQSSTQIEPKKTSIKKEEIPVKSDDSIASDNEKDVIHAKTEKEVLPASDQTKMILDLFDGKYVD